MSSTLRTKTGLFASTVAMFCSAVLVAAEPPVPVQDALLKNAETFAEAFNQGDAQALASAFVETGEMVSEDGSRVEGRDAIAAHFSRYFQDFADARLDLQVLELRAVSPTLVIEEGVSTLVPVPGGAHEVSSYIVIHTLEGKEWLLASIYDTGIPRRVESNIVYLQSLDFLVGDWIDEGADAIVEFEGEWADNGNFLVQSFKLRREGQSELTGTVRIGWDGQSNQIRSWTFDSEGGFAEGRWATTPEGWTISSRGVNSRGQATSSTSLVIRQDAETVLWKTYDRTVGGKQLDDDAAVVLKRKPPQPGS